MEEKKNTTSKNVALRLCVTAMFSALLVGGKAALAVIPNVEVVTIVIAVCAYVWGLSVAMPAVFVFIAVDAAIWGVNTWVVSYVIHWNAVALGFWLYSKFRPNNKILTAVFATLLAIVVTALFGVLTSAVDTLIGFTGVGFFVDFENFFPRFAVMYVAGVPFFATQIACNAALFAVAFFPLVVVNTRAKARLLQ